MKACSAEEKSVFHLDVSESVMATMHRSGGVVGMFDLGWSMPGHDQLLAD